MLHSQGEGIELFFIEFFGQRDCLGDGASFKEEGQGFKDISLKLEHLLMEVITGC